MLAKYLLVFLFLASPGCGPQPVNQGLTGKPKDGARVVPGTQHEYLKSRWEALASQLKIGTAQTKTEDVLRAQLSQPPGVMEDAEFTQEVQKFMAHRIPATQCGKVSTLEEINVESLKTHNGKKRVGAENLEGVRAFLMVYNPAQQGFPILAEAKHALNAALIFAPKDDAKGPLVLYNHASHGNGLLGEVLQVIGPLLQKAVVVAPIPSAPAVWPELGNDVLGKLSHHLSAHLPSLLAASRPTITFLEDVEQALAAHNCVVQFANAPTKDHEKWLASQLLRHDNGLFKGTPKSVIAGIDRGAQATQMALARIGNQLQVMNQKEVPAAEKQKRLAALPKFSCAVTAMGPAGYLIGWGRLALKQSIYGTLPYTPLYHLPGMKSLEYLSKSYVDGGPWKDPRAYATILAAMDPVLNSPLTVGSLKNWTLFNPLKPDAKERGAYLMLHGQDDKYIGRENSEILYNAYLAVYGKLYLAKANIFVTKPLLRLFALKEEEKTAFNLASPTFQHGDEAFFASLSHGDVKLMDASFDYIHDKRSLLGKTPRQVLGEWFAAGECTQVLK